MLETPSLFDKRHSKRQRAVNRHFDNSLCSARRIKSHRPLVSKDTVQDKEIGGIKRKLAEFQRLINMLLVLVDPVDVRAALELPRQTPSAGTLREWAAKSQSPDNLSDAEEEKPW